MLSSSPMSHIKLDRALITDNTNFIITFATDKNLVIVQEGHIGLCTFASLSAHQLHLRWEPVDLC